MGNTYSSLLVHLVFSTKDRAPLVTADNRERLYEYMGGIIRHERGSLLEIGGMPDHVHLLVRHKTSLSVADLLRLIKGGSSHWMNQLPDSSPFGWQNGYGAFSVSESRIAAVRKYIRTQEEHHTRRTFRDELITLLRKHNIDYDEKYLLD